MEFLLWTVYGQQLRESVGLHTSQHSILNIELHIQSWPSLISIPVLYVGSTSFRGTEPAFLMHDIHTKWKADLINAQFVET